MRRGVGLLRRLSEACRATVRNKARIHPLGHVYDNINFIFRAAEQILGRKDAQENGTCATVFPLFDAPTEDMRTSDLLEAFDSAQPLAISDIQLSAAENVMLKQQIQHTVLRIITIFGGPGFAKFQDEVAN